MPKPMAIVWNWIKHSQQLSSHSIIYSHSTLWSFRSTVKSWKYNGIFKHVFIILATEWYNEGVWEGRLVTNEILLI